MGAVQTSAEEGNHCSDSNKHFDAPESSMTAGPDSGSRTATVSSVFSGAENEEDMFPAPIYFLRSRSSCCSASLPTLSDLSQNTAPIVPSSQDDRDITSVSMENGRISCAVIEDATTKKFSLPASFPKQMPTFLQACEQCDEDLVRYYIASGISTEELNAQDKTGKTGLSHACANGFVTIVSLLRLPNIDVNLADNEGNTPLIFASQAGHGDIVSLLLNYFPGIELDKNNNQGFTALMKAAIQGRARCAKLLLYAGASLYKRDHGRGLCALEWAEYCNRQTCAKTIGQFAEACNLGIICSSFMSNSRNCLSASRNKWKSDSSINSDTAPAVNCIPFKLLSSKSKFASSLHLVSEDAQFAFRRVRRSLPVTPAGAAGGSHNSAMRSLEEVARCLYTPVFPECFSQTVSPLARSPSLNSGRRGRHGGVGSYSSVIPKVEITLTSKDDNYYYENAVPFASAKQSSKFKRYVTQSAE